MAKTKPTHHDNPRKIQDHTHQTPASMDVPYEKFENLKSLNSMLLKEAVEHRQQVESLVHSKGSLESALTRSEMENHELQAELTRLHDCTAQLHQERNLVFVFVAVQLRHQAEAFEKERDGLRRERVQIENRLETLEKEMGELETINNAFKNREIKVEDMKREVEVLQNSVAEARKRKSFLTVVCSATAILAAAVASVAYVARGR